MAMLNRESSFYNQYNLEEKPEYRGKFRTWQLLWDALDISPIELPWNADGSSVLAILREKYGAQFKALQNSELDDIVHRFGHCSVNEQFDALGSAVKLYGLVFYKIGVECGKRHLYCLVAEENFEQKLESIHSDVVVKQVRRCLNEVRLERGYSLENPLEKIALPAATIQLTNNKYEYVYNFLNNDMFTIEHFLVVVRNNRKAPEEMNTNADLVSWLKEDIHFHNVPLESWQEEERRAYENFPEVERFRRFDSNKADDRMVIKFKDGKKYDIIFKESRETEN